MDNPDKKQPLSPEIEEILSRCTEREAKVLRLRLGLEDGKCKTLQETSEILGISPDRIRHMEHKAMHRHSIHRVKKIKDFYT